MKLLRWLAGIFIALMLLVWLGGRWLTRDDLATCQAAPSSAEQCQAADAIVAVSGGDTQARTAEAPLTRLAPAMPRQCAAKPWRLVCPTVLFSPRN